MRRKCILAALVCGSLLIAALVAALLREHQCLYKVTFLPTMGGVKARAHAINDSGQIVSAVRWADGTAHVVLWDKSDRTREIASFPRDHVVFALALNNPGQIASTVIDPNHRWRSFFWDTDGRKYTLDTPRGRIQIVALNSRGQIVGHGDTPQRPGHVFTWDKIAGMQDLGTFGGIESLARGINDAGQIVGFLSTVKNEWRAFLYDPNLGTRDLGPTRFGPLATGCINNQGFVVGQFGSADDTSVSTWTAGAGPHRLPPVSGDYVQVRALNDANCFLLNVHRSGVTLWTLQIGIRDEVHLWEAARHIRCLNKHLGRADLEGLRVHDINNDGTILGSLSERNRPYPYAVILEPIK